MLNYLEGSNHCQLNSDRLQASARIILNNSDGTDSFGLFFMWIYSIDVLHLKQSVIPFSNSFQYLLDCVNNFLKLATKIRNNFLNS
jgi:hypothetical protein